MGFRKKRTTKSVGRKIAKDIAEIKQQQKILRTLKKEAEIRKKKENLSKRILKLKKQRPSIAKSVGRSIGKGVKSTFEQLKKLEPSKKQRKETDDFLDWASKF